MTVGWKLDPAAHLALIEEFPPRYGRYIADHITLPAAHDAALPQPAEEALVVGHADDGEGVEALIVALNGSTERPDGGTWHMTWSLGPGRRAQESNAVIARCGWTALDPRPLLVYPAKW